MPNDYRFVSVGLNAITLIEYYSQGSVCSSPVFSVDDSSLSHRQCPCQHFPRCEDDRWGLRLFSASIVISVVYSYRRDRFVICAIYFSTFLCRIGIFCFRLGACRIHIGRHGRYLLCALNVYPGGIDLINRKATLTCSWVP